MRSTGETFHSLGAYVDFLIMPLPALIYVNPQDRVLWHHIVVYPLGELYNIVNIRNETANLASSNPERSTAVEKA